MKHECQKCSSLPQSQAPREAGSAAEEKECRTCLWWCGDREDEAAFCDEKETDVEAGSHCPKWQKKREPSDQMTDAQKQELRKIVGKGCTDSGIEDFCERNGVTQRAAFHQLAVWAAPPQCKGCEKVDMYSNMPPPAHAA